MVRPGSKEKYNDNYKFNFTTSDARNAVYGDPIARELNQTKKLELWGDIRKPDYKSNIVKVEVKFRGQGGGDQTKNLYCHKKIKDLIISIFDQIYKINKD